MPDKRAEPKEHRIGQDDDRPGVEGSCKLCGKLLASIFNWKIAIAYVVVGLILAVAGGTIISRLKLEKYVEPFVFANKLWQLSASKGFAHAGQSPRGRTATLHAERECLPTTRS